MRIRGLAFSTVGFMRSFWHVRPDILALAAMLMAAGLAGCKFGPPTGEVRGKVTFKGNPVTEGTITFLNPSGGGNGEAQIGKDGSYEVRGGLTVGDYIVLVTPPLHLVDTDPGKTPPSLVEKPAPNIPQKYRGQGSSPLRVKIEKGKNEHDFDMKP